MVEVKYILGGLVFACTISAYIALVLFGKHWKKKYFSESLKYWKTSKEDRVLDLTEKVWQPRLISTLYSLAYFTNGYNRVVFTIWIPFFLFQVRNLETLEVAFFVSLIYISWGWKMFIGLIADIFPIPFRGKPYRRLPWFFLTGLLYLICTLILVIYDTTSMPVWNLFLPTIIMVTTAGAIFDISADSYVVDMTPPNWHGRVLGTASRIGRALGGALASVLPPILINIGGYGLVFLSATLTGLFSFLFLILKEPPLEEERTFNRKAIALTFTEKTVILGCLTTFLFAFSLRPIANPLGGMFAFIVKEVAGISPELVGNISLLTLLCALPGSILAGWASDKWGHKKMFIISGVSLALSGLLWINLRGGMVIWFTSTAMLISFLQTFNLACLLALMGDITPLALSSTVFQMYMSFIWIGNVPSSILTGILVDMNLSLLLIFMSISTLVMTISGGLIKPFEAGKANKT